MANAGSLYVSILARTGGFKKGMRGVRRDIMGFKSSIGGVAAALSGAALGGGLAFFVKQNLDAMAATGRLSDRLGITTEELIAMREAAEDNGIGFEQMQKGLQKLAVTAGAAGFTGNTAEAFYKVTDAISGMTNTNARAALAQKAFGKSGVEMLNFLNGARGKIEEARKSNDALNLSFSKMDAAKAQAANIALNNMKDVFTGIATQAAPLVSAVLIAISEKFIGLAKDGQTSFGVIMDKIGGMTGVIARVMDYFELLKAGWYFFESAVKVGAGLVVNSIYNIARSMEQLINMIPGMNVKLSGALGALNDDLAKSMFESVDKGTEALYNFNNATHSKEAQQWLDSINKRAVEVASSITQAGNTITDMGGGDVGASAKMKKNSFDLAQGDISRFAIGFESKMNKQKNPQIDKTNQILTQILNKTGSNNAAVFA